MTSSYDMVELNLVLEHGNAGQKTGFDLAIIIARVVGLVVLEPETPGGQPILIYFGCYKSPAPGRLDWVPRP